jgi:hypothetical protein
MARAPRLATAALLLLAWGCNNRPEGPAEPEPTPEPTAAPTDDAGQFACRLSKMPDNGYCPYQAMLFYAQFEKALDETIQRRPDLFDLDDTRGCDTCYHIRDGHEFYRVFINRLERMGFCAQCDEECGIKNSNAFNEQYDVIVSQGYIRRGIGAYRGTCYPASF